MREEFSAEKALEVLSTPYGSSPIEDLALLKVQLPVLADGSVSSTQYHRLLDLFYTRTQKLSADLKPRLRDASLPLTREIRNIARDLSEVFRAIAAGYRWVLANMGQARGGADNPMRNPRVLMGRAMKCLAEQLEVAGLTAAPQPGGVWHAAYQLYLEACQEKMEEGASAPTDTEQVFREMLALNTAAPESLSSREVSLVAEYAGLFAASVIIFDAPPPSDQDVSLYWIDVGNDQAPYAMARRTPPFGMDQILYFSCARLSEVVEGQLRALENGFQPKDLRLPDSADTAGYVPLLRRLLKRWREPPKRQFPRRRNNYQMQLCPGFDAFWRLLEQQDQGIPVLDVGMVSDWMVVNESPAGYALMHTAGTVDNLQNGSVVALRTKAGQPWEVCIVRWMTSENPEHIELGVQVVAHGAQPIRVGFRGVKNASLQAGLLLEPVTALRSKRAILTLAGTCRSRRFVMISGASKIYVAQGEVLSLDLQTASVELFQFEPDHNPI
ncbi:MAG: hypothetical protein PHU46_13090 [Rhodocyclaceae bacterium]|nr:hypothetical protein [Rhodocyclaceae bacterium]